MATPDKANGQRPRSEIAQRLEVWLRDRGWTAAELSRQSGVNKETISKWVQGRVDQPRRADLAKVLRAFGKNEVELFCDQSEIQQQWQHLVEVLKLVERLCGPENADHDPCRDIRMVVRLALQRQPSCQTPQAPRLLNIDTPVSHVGASKLIIDARKRLGFSQTELAKRCGVTKGVISQWENEIGAPKRANARKLATVLRIDPLELEARLSAGTRGEQE